MKRVVFLFALFGCSTEQPTVLEKEEASVSVSSLPIAIASSAEEIASWNHQVTTMVDLNDDGVEDELVLAADVSLDPKGRPQWEDGHRWAVVVKDQAGQTTVVYAQFLPFGTVEVSVTTTSGTSNLGRSQLFIVERGPHRRRAFDILYEGVGAATVVGQAGGEVNDPTRHILSLSS